MSNGLLPPFVSDEKKEPEQNQIRVVLSKTKDKKVGKIPEVLYRTARDNLKKDFFRIWWCNHYNIPPTDPRFLEYTQEALAIEWLEYAIDNDLIMLGADGMPAQPVDHNGETIFETGFDEWDEEERRWAEQKPVSEIYAEQQASEEVDVLAEIDAKLDAEENTGEST